MDGKYRNVSITKSASVQSFDLFHSRVFSRLFTPMNDAEKCRDERTCHERGLLRKENVLSLSLSLSLSLTFFSLLFVLFCVIFFSFLPLFSYFFSST